MPWPQPFLSGFFLTHITEITTELPPRVRLLGLWSRRPPGILQIHRCVRAHPLRISNSPVIILFFLLPGSPSCSGGALLPNRGERDCQANVGGWESIEVGDMSITRKNYLQSLGRMGPYTQRRGLMDRVAKRLETCHLCIRVCV